MADERVQILECTLRDGSYAIDFQFTAKDTALIVAALERAGVEWIELGHGMGLNASRAGCGLAAATDEEYLQAAAHTLKRARWGMFFIPGIGRLEDLELAAGYGMHFVRIGVNAPEARRAQTAIEKAKHWGLHVSANLMKAYAVPPPALGEQAKCLAAAGADMVTLVDSAGYLLPEDVRTYVQALQDAVQTPIGLHGHDNLGLGMANVLAALACGVRRVDSTLQGMGRGGGNPATEVLVTVLKRRGMDVGIDLNQIMDAGERLIKPKLHQAGWNALNITAGYAGFHSSHLHIILQYADRYGVDARDLMVAVCQHNQIDAPEELVDAAARALKEQQRGRSGLHLVALPTVSFPEAAGVSASDETLSAVARQVAREVRAAAKKCGRRSVFNIVAAFPAGGKTVVSRFVQEEFDFVIGSVAVDTPAHVCEVVDAVDGIVDLLLVDGESRPAPGRSLLTLAQARAQHSHVLGYLDSEVWVRSVVQQVAQLVPPSDDRPIVVYGLDRLALNVALALLERHYAVVLTGAPTEAMDAAVSRLRGMAEGRGRVEHQARPVAAAHAAAAVVRFGREAPLMEAEVVAAVAPDGIVFDAGIGCLTDAAMACAHQRGVRMVRPDMRAALAAELALLVGAARLTQDIMGRGLIAGVPVVAGGLIGRYGELVVDSLAHPTKIVGVADGRGSVIYERRPEFAAALTAVETAILQTQLLKPPLPDGPRDDV